MAIFIASTKSISRGKGQSAVASASYRAGVELEDKRYGKTHDYSKRHGVMSADIILPSALASADAEIDRSELWNKSEAAEKRVDARVAREWLVNLPHELNEQDRKEIAHKFAQTLADRYGTIADCAIHKPTDKEIARGADPRNYHAHIMFTTRTAELDDNNEIILTDKATVELSDTNRGKLGLQRVSHEIKEVRLIWEQIANDKLAEHNHELIDSRSYAEQGIDILPQVKMGVDATHLERRTEETSIRGEVNRLIAQRNELVWNTTLAKNQKVNDKADRTIADLRESKLFIFPTAPKPDFKARNISNVDLASAHDTVNRLKALQLNREKAQQAEQERLRQQGIALAAQQERERLEQERLEQQQRQERISKRMAAETGQFNQHYQRLKHQPVSADSSLSKKIDKNSAFGEHINALTATDRLMSALKDYQGDPTTTQHQRTLTTQKYEHLGNTLISQSQTALDDIKNTRHTATQKNHTAALKSIWDDMVGHHQPNLSKTQQERLQSVSAAINNHSRDINHSHGMGLGF